MKKIFSAGTGLHANRSAAGTAVVFLILLFTSLLMMMPFVYSIVQSLKPMEELFAFPPKFFVQNPTAENYQKLFQLTENLWVPFSRYVFNSVFVSVAGTALYILVASMAAYSLAFGDFPGAKLFNEIVVQALLFSSSVLAVSQYVILAKGRMLNTYWAVILPALSAPLGLFLMRQFMEQMIPKSMLEAAQIDGATSWQTLWKIKIPMVMSSITICVFLTLTNSFKLFDQNLSLTAGEPNHATEMLALNIYNTFYARSGPQWKGIGQAKAVIFFVLVVAIGLIQLRATRSREVQQ